jgi:hypothetical protein
MVRQSSNARVRGLELAPGVFSSSMEGSCAFNLWIGLLRRHQLVEMIKVLRTGMRIFRLKPHDLAYGKIVYFSRVLNHTLVKYDVSKLLVHG